MIEKKTIAHHGYKKILIVAATQKEIESLQRYIDNIAKEKIGTSQFIFLVTGIGMLATATALTMAVIEHCPDFVVQIGISGCFDAAIPLGAVLAVSEEIIGDMGVEENNKWTNIFDLGLENPNATPYKNGRLSNPHLLADNFIQLKKVVGISVNEISTNVNRIQKIITAYQPIVESMEGAALHYVCLQRSIPFLQLRAISNYVGERNKNNWEIKTALDNLHTTLLAILF